jgi:ATP-dependent RNA helicase RhlE
VGVYGGVNINTQKLAVEDGVDIMVGTPGRLIDLIYDASFKTKNIKKLVIDEVDEMLNLGFRTQLKNILDTLPLKRQNLMFSATMTEEVDQLIDTFFNSPITIEAAPTGTPLANIEQIAYRVPNFYTKVNLLKLILMSNETMTKVLVFVATKQMADEIYNELEQIFTDRIGVIHSNKHQNHRLNTVTSFQEGKYQYLIATDIIARGLDISEVTHVINFDTPEIPESYIHRIGRTGRADRKGIAMTFISDREVENFNKIEALMNVKVLENELPENLIISDVLTEDEKPKVKMKTFLVKPPKKEAVGPAFHEKSAKNSKVNFKVSHKDKMMKKYGKPIKKSGKKK